MAEKQYRQAIARQGQLPATPLPRRHVIAGTLLCLLFLCLTPAARSQTATDGGDWRQDLAEWLADEDTEEAAVAAIQEQMEQLAAEPLPINTATKAQLRGLGILSDAQIESIGDYIGRHGAITSAAELMAIPLIGVATARLLRHFVAFQTGSDEGAGKAMPSLKEARHEAVATLNLPFYTTYGDRVAFLGPRYKHSLRYRMSMKGRVEAGLVASQDAGEPFFIGRNKWGYDHFSPYFLYRGDGVLATLAVGNYRVGIGMGLVANTNFSFGKAAQVAALGQAGQQLRPHSSRSASNYLQGAAAELRLCRGVDATVFASSRPIDATLSGDGTEIRTILTTGYHRTATEMSHKNAARHTVGGGYLSYTWGHWRIGAGGVGQVLSRRLQPDTTAIYRRHYPAGKSFWNVSAYYSCQQAHLSLRGEVATGGCGGVATAHALVYEPSARLALRLALRHYSARYGSLLANSFGNSHDARNETGALFGLTLDMGHATRMDFYTDIAHSPFPHYGISAPSWEWDNSLALRRRLPRADITLRYRLRLRQRDDASGTLLRTYTEQRLRLGVASNGYGMAEWRVQADAAMSRRQGNSLGVMLSAMGGLRTERLRIRATAAWFSTDDYYSRLYAVESGLRYQMYMPSFYGRGCRATLLATARLGSRLAMTARLAATKYFDRESIGTSYSRVDSSAKADIELQMVYTIKPKRGRR